ncbi:MAG TPA: carboxylesterase family protein [Herpetosiphonaceae bacterium]|nr:carboxylesterase family protein [Herpetosiphonaceae bacterium]
MSSERPDDPLGQNRAMTASGTVEGTLDPVGRVRSFKGIPFAAPPLGDLRWRPPQPAPRWEDIRPATAFGPRAMQLALFGDMNFRSDGMSEDCLYLNVWTPAESSRERRPVLLYFYGGGNQAGDGSEPRYDGASLAARGIVALTANYRLNVFGFLAHPELSAESPAGASGNYGHLDQAAAIRWVRENIAAFGGDPDRITIAGESAGSMGVSAQMASPLARDLLAGAIGSSGALMGALRAAPLAAAEHMGLEYAASLGASSLAELRAMPAERLLAACAPRPGLEFKSVVDGYFLPRPPEEIYAAGEQARVPLLCGWNSEEMSYKTLLEDSEPTPENFAAALRPICREWTEAALALYPAATVDQTIAAATEFTSDFVIAHNTWKWCELHGRTGGAPVFRYLYAHPRPPMRPEMGDAVAGFAGGVITGPEAAAQRTPPPRGAVHSAEIEYAMGNLATNHVYAWTGEDERVSALMQAYYVNFITAGDPNRPGAPEWPPANQGETVRVMTLGPNPRAEPERGRERLLLIDHFAE